ncbi:MAG: hypothetical protein CVU50_09425 [Candidatus Cloacimonetes bacterium HGW-Cloacimonetes-3]|jgi:hypothetical protein|nr:MAG: hypothetical protein CVU50_09425 [Candidatus Cloacimonetes bacterium HGW-Cloacimonetes-3]
MKLLNFVPLVCILAALFFAPMQLAAQNFYEPTQVNTIHLYFSEANWDQLLDNLASAGQEERLTGSAIINGVPYDSVGVRYKGNSSYSANRNKNPFNIKLDYVLDDQLMDGVYGTIKLSNGFNDPSLIRETLAYEIARKYMPASLANYANVYVNDVLIGIYTSVQDVDSYFMRTHLGCSGKPRFKSETNPTGTSVIWGYLGADSTAYAAKYEIESDYGWSDIINFTNVLNNDQNNVANVLNVDQHLWFLAFENLLDNFDSPINIFHNFYLFGDEDGRINPIVWDLNEAFGTYNRVGTSNLSITQLQNYNPLANLTSSTHTLISKVLSNPRYKMMYIAHMRTMLTENFTNGWYATRGAELQSICAPYVQADPNFFYTYANFTSNLNTTITGPRTIPGITTLMNTRSTYLLNNSAFAGTLPQISALDYSPANPLPNSTVSFTLTATDANFAQLGIRQNAAQKFNYYQMWDDGQHGDGAANDGVFGVSVPIGYGNLQYYAWAENSTQGAFYPARAEHEFFSIAVDSPMGGIQFNEINYNSSDEFDPGDWVEIHNPGTDAVDISNWVFKDGDNSHVFTIPQGTTLSANGFLVLCQSLAEFTAVFPAVTNVLGDFDFGLSGSGEAVRLYTSNGETVDSVFYGVNAPWPTEPNGNGSTLALISPELDNNLPASWQASLGHGTPGSSNSNTEVEDNLVSPVLATISCYPNPFKSHTTIEYKVPDNMKTTLSIYNIRGQKVRTLIDNQDAKGTNKITWNGSDSRQQKLGSGIYFVLMQSEGRVLKTQKLVLLN